MRLTFQRYCNIAKLKEELITQNLIQPVTEEGISTVQGNDFITCVSVPFDDNLAVGTSDPADVNILTFEAIALAVKTHDPTPVPPEPTEVEILGMQLVEKDLQILELQTQNELLGQQLVNQELKSMELENANTMLGMQVVDQELRNFELQQQNDTLGQQLVGMDLRLLKLENGGVA